MTSERKSPGRPRGEAAASHAAIMEAVFQLLQERSVRDLTMEAVARRAGVGKPTLYKWWPSKAALVFAMFHERLTSAPDLAPDASAEAALRTRVRHLIAALNGSFGKVMADLIAEGQSDAGLLKDLFEQHVRERRDATIAEIERGKVSGEFPARLDAVLAVDAMVGAIYYRHLLRFAPLTEEYGERLVDQMIGISV
jgi:AcrR family transcriptional regulator